ncbi:MAG: hypothetical protein R3Y60_00715 [bacterium]
MKALKTIFLGIFDPITTFISKSFPGVAHKILNKHVLIQFVIALLITAAIILIGRW